MTGGEDRFMAAMHQMRDAFQVLKEDAPWGAYDAENGQFYDGYAEVKEMFAVALAASETVAAYWVQGAVTEAPDTWMYLTGCSFDTREELEEVFQRQFAPIQGQGCRYRKVQVEETVTRTVTVLP